MEEAMRELFPTVGDVVAFGVWILFFGGLISGFVAQLRLERRRRERREHDARYPIANRYAHPRWRP